MKRFLMIIIFAAFGISGCKKFLDTVPNGSLVPENSYASPAQITAAISGMYTNLKYVVGYAQFYTAYYTAPTDESYHYNASNGFACFAATPGDNITGNPNSNLWKGCYQSINYCNTMLDNIDVSSAGKVDPNIVRRAKGEALFLRGFHYFILAQFYGDVPMSIHATTDPTQSQIARTPVKDVYNQIIDDMTQADTLMYDQTFTSLGYSDRISRTGVEAMLARVCMYAAGAPVNDTKRYKDALAWCQKVVASGQHSLMSSYPQVFIDEAKNVYNRENIFEIGFNRRDASLVSASGGIGVYVGPSMGSSNGTTSTGATAYDSGWVYSYLKLHPRLYFTYEAGDRRRDWNIANWTTGTSSIAASPSAATGVLTFGPSGVGSKIPLANNRYWSKQPAKWRREYEPQLSRSVQQTSNTNFPVIRYSDVLLMLAEAEYEVNGATAVAYDALNLVRRRAFSTTPVVDSITYVQGTGYNSAPDSIAINFGGGTGFSFNVLYNGTTAKTVQVLLTGQGSGYTSAPTVTIGRQWRAGTAYTVNTQVAAPNGRLYTVTTAGTSTATPPTNTSGASTAATTGAVFTYAGFACTVTTYLSAVPVVDYNASVLATKGITFKQAIMDERARELCFEALRLGDLKRWGILVPTIQGLAADINGANPLYPKLTSAVSELGTGNDAAARAPVNNVSAKDMFYPIPQWDLNLNKKLTQNPGY